MPIFLSMPYKDPEEQKEYVDTWHENHAEEVRRRKAEWYQKNKAARRAQQNRYRRAVKAEEAADLIKMVLNNEDEK